ncbi:hypothetical protein DPEC_G00042410, partial [Dallia pectoralis]
MDPNNCETQIWTKTKEAAAHFRELLLCSKCSNLMNEPVCLGLCEHMFCRLCAGPQAGVGCVVCHSPAWVKDIQINRQLSNITELFCNLDSMLNPSDPENTDVLISSPVQSGNSVLKHKKNFKIWFSPRSRKVRCRVETPVDVSQLSEENKNRGKAALKPTNTEPACNLKDLSVFNFSSSSQDSGSSSLQKATNWGKKKKKKNRNGGRDFRHADEVCQKPTTRKESRQKVKTQRLVAVNQQWGFGGAEDAREGEQDSIGRSVRRSSKRVSFKSPAPLCVSGEPQIDSVIPSKSILKVGQSGEKIPLSEDQDASSPHTSYQMDLQSVNRDSKLSEKTPTLPDLSSTKPPLKIPHADESNALQCTPKRPKVSPGQGTRPAQVKVPVLSLPTSPSSPAASPRQGSTSITRRPKGGDNHRGRTTCSPASSGKRSPGNRSQSSPAAMKRNHKGETPLHLAAIKGDVEAVKTLLDQGDDPNIKDNAGWTPLHEACNLGHPGVVEVLVSRGVLLNTPGYENDSPLHDAVRNGHVGIAKLLLQHGASPSVLNLYGLRPVDYAMSPEMQAVICAPSEQLLPGKSPVHSPPGLNKASEEDIEDKPVVLLGSKLSKYQQNKLTKLGQLLGGKKTSIFSGSVTHVVVPDPTTPSTLSTLLGLLNGCWVLNFSWVEACLQADSWTAETDHEIGVGPQRSRINRHSLLPPLFDGCFFYFLGSFRKHTKDELVQMVREAGGQVLTRQPKPDSDVTQTLPAASYHASPGSDQALCTQYIIYDPQGPYRPPR